MSNGVPAPQPHKARIYLIATAAAVGGFLFGYDVSMISGAILFLQTHFGLSPAEKGWAMVSAQVGVLGGNLVAGPLSDGMGRRRALFIAALLFGASALGTALPKTIFWWNVFRIVGGIGGGIALVVSPLYISEISPARIRGRLVLMNQIAIVVSILAASVVAFYLAPVANQWRWMFASVMPLAVALATCLWFIPESPRWLIQTGRVEKGREIIRSLAGAENADGEVADIQQSLSEETGRLSELFAPGLRMALMVAVAIAVFQQTTGGSTLLNYAPTIFKEAGAVGNQSAIGQAIVLNSFTILFTLIAITIVDRRGRRPLLLAGALCMAVGQALVGGFFHFNLPAGLALVFVVLATGAYTISFGPLGWLVMAEVFPTRIRARGMAVATFLLVIGALVTNGYFPVLLAKSKALPFWLFGAMCILAFAFCLRFVPETKGRTLEEIASSWTRKKSETV